MLSYNGIKIAEYLDLTNARDITSAKKDFALDNKTGGPCFGEMGSKAGVVISTSFNYIS